MILSDLRTEVRRRSDQENSQFIKDVELLTYINQSYAELYDILVSRFEDYYITELQFNVVTSQYALPADFYKMRGIDRSISGAGSNDWVNVPKFNFTERNKRTRSIVYNIKGQLAITYRVFGDNIEFRPEDSCAGLYRMWYVPRYIPLVDDTDAPVGVMDYEEYIIVDSAIKCAQKEESDVSVLMAQKNFLLERIKTMSSNRDAGEPERIADSKNNYYDWEQLGYGR